MASPSSPVLVDDAEVLRELAPTAGRLMERHLERSKEWFPHEHVPWSRGRDFAAGEPTPAEPHLPESVRSALVVNLLTEDNLPYYTQSIGRIVGLGGVWGEWTRRWTAEEDRHSTVIRDYLCVTRCVDLVALERARMTQVSNGYEPTYAHTALDLFVYLALQELATRIAHRNTGALLDDEAGTDVMARVAADENLHFLFYRDLVSAALHAYPGATVAAIERQVRHFEMPGAGIPGFDEHARRIAKAGIYDVPIHLTRIVEPTVLRDWGVEGLELPAGPATELRDKLFEFIGRLRRVVSRVQERAAAGTEQSERVDA
jgi:acyl-[acyl-carrier-protein] desaturase